MDDAVSGWWAVAFVVQWALVLVLAVVVVALARQVGTLHLRLGPRGALEIDTEGPELGLPLDPLPVRTADGSTQLLGGPGAPRLVLVSSPTCPICAEVAPGIPVAAAGAGMESQILHDRDAEEALGVPGTPYVIVLDERGVVRSKGTVNNMEQIEGLVDTASRRIQDERWAS